MKAADLIIIAGTLCCGLMAGLFFTWSNSVTTGLGKLSDSEYLRAMQSMNREILNPVFFACFFGALVLIPWSAFIARNDKILFILLSVAALFYVGGVFIVTVAGNVPLNEKLAVMDVSASTKEMQHLFRAEFENRWNFLNNIRAISSVAAFVLMVIGCIKR